MCDSRLNLLFPSDGRLISVAHDIDERDAIQVDHFLKVDEASIVPVDILNRNSEVCPITVGLHDDAPIRCRKLRCGDKHEDG